MQGTYSLFITDPLKSLDPKKDTTVLWMQEVFSMGGQILQCEMKDLLYNCLLYTSDAADDVRCVYLGGRRIIKKNF